MPEKKKDNLKLRLWGIVGITMEPILMAMQPDFDGIRHRLERCCAWGLTIRVASESLEEKMAYRFYLSTIAPYYPPKNVGSLYLCSVSWSCDMICLLALRSCFNWVILSLRVSRRLRQTSCRHLGSFRSSFPAEAAGCGKDIELRRDWISSVTLVLPVASIPPLLSFESDGFLK